MDIFDSNIIHIGGDEVLPAHFCCCEKCKEFCKENGFDQKLDEYQAWFTRKIADFVNEKGRKIIGWDEICNDNLSKDNFVMVWRCASIANDIIKSGFKVVIAPNECFYFDHYQFTENDNYQYFGANISKLSNVYSYNPLKHIPQKEMILGVQACAWAEKMVDFNNVQWKVFPRICALAEVAWTRPEIKNFDKFNDGLTNVHFKRLSHLNINYASLEKSKK